MSAGTVRGTAGTVLEICVDDVAGARDAEAAGADRVEVCVGLAEGGLTPSLGLVRQVLAATARVGVQVILRPRGGDFVHSPEEVAVMAADLTDLLALGDPRVGLVLGSLTPEGQVDRATLQSLTGAAGGAEVTFHKAFDLVPDPVRALEELVGLGVTRVLTSGGRRSARDGSDQLRGLVRQADGRISVMAGGGVRADHVRELVRATGVAEVHLRATREVPSADRRRTADRTPDRTTDRTATADGGLGYDVGTRRVTDAAVVAAVRAELDRPG